MPPDVAEETTTTDVTPPSDADATTAADAVELDEAAGKESAEDAPEAAAPDAVTEEFPDLKTALADATAKAEAAASEKGRNEALEQVRREQQDAQAAQQARLKEQAYVQNYRNRAEEARLEAHDLAIESGRPETEAAALGEKAAQRINTQHAEGIELYEADARAFARTEADTNLSKALTAGLPSEIRAKVDAKLAEKKAAGTGYGWQDVFADIAVFAREGRRTPAEFDAAVAAATLPYIAKLEQLGGVPGASSGAVANGGAATQQITYSQLLKMTDAQVDALPEGMVSEITAKAISEGK